MNHRGRSVRNFFALLLICFLNTPLNAPADAPIVDPATKQSMEQLIEQYIRSHPEVIEQSLQALEAKREVEEKARQKSAIAARQNDLLHDPSSPVSGNPSGDVTLVEFFDYRCGYCKRAAGAVTQLQKKTCASASSTRTSPFWGEPRSSPRKRPSHRNSNKHQAFHEALLASKGDMTKHSILEIAAEVGLDTKRLEADMANPEWQQVIEANRTLARDLGINGTPGFIVGTELVPGALDVNGLKELIARATNPK